MPTTSNDPFSGPLAGTTGRLEKLRWELNAVRFGEDTTEERKVDRLLFVSAMLIDLVDELAQQLAEVLPEGAGDRHR
jgi:hypothetical protein